MYIRRSIYRTNMNTRVWGWGLPPADHQTPANFHVDLSHSVNVQISSSTFGQNRLPHGGDSLAPGEGDRFMFDLSSGDQREALFSSPSGAQDASVASTSCASTALEDSSVLEHVRYQ